MQHTNLVQNQDDSESEASIPFFEKIVTVIQ